MFPGMRGMNPKQMEAMMRKMGIKNENVKATEVIIIKPGGNIHIKEPSVTVMTVQGERTWQISGREVLEGKDSPKSASKGAEPKVKPKPKEPEEEPQEEFEDELPSGPAYAEEDVKLVMEQAHCSETEARKALEKSDGQPAEAILFLMSKK